MTPPPPRLPGHAVVINYIRTRIATGEYPPGAELPSIVTLSRLTGESQTAVKTALLLLRHDGTITSRPGKATYVAEQDPPV